MTTKKAAAKKAATKSPRKTAVHKWSAAIDTDETHPDHGLFLKDAQTIADALYSRRVSPKGPASGMQMLNFYINRAGKNLPKERQGVLEHAKEILSSKIAEDKPAGRGAKKAAKKTARKSATKSAKQAKKS